MIKATIQAEDYYIGEALANFSSRIETDDILDAVYDGNEKEVTIQGDHYTAVFSKCDNALA